MRFLESIGMVVNASKTEIMYMKHRQPPPKELVINDQPMKVLTEMKVLGITFDWMMNWSIHMENMIAKSNKMMSGLKIIRNKFSEKQFMQIVTSQYYGNLNYAMQVWFTSSLNKKFKSKMDVLHFKPLRTAIRDWE